MDLERCKELVDGLEEPETLEESIFVDAYTAAVEGVLLITHVVGLGSDFDLFDGETLHYLILGYSWGQWDLKESEGIFNQTEDKSKKFH